MDGEKRWRTERSGGDGCSQDNSIINRIMLRFRPIAPKPAAGDSASGVVPPGNKNVFLSIARKKRKYVRVRKSDGNRRKKRSEEESNDPLEKTVVTLQLSPERIDSRESLESRFLRDLNGTVLVSQPDSAGKQGPPARLSFNKPWINGLSGLSGADLAAVAPPRTVESWVTVERVTDTCMDVVGLGRTDVERLENLKSDTCPGFISDGWDRVQWINEAYRRLVSRREGEVESPETALIPLLCVHG